MSIFSRWLKAKKPEIELLAENEGVRVFALRNCGHPCGPQALTMTGVSIGDPNPCDSTFRCHDAEVVYKITGDIVVTAKYYTTLQESPAAKYRSIDDEWEA